MVHTVQHLSSSTQCRFASQIRISFFKKHLLVGQISREEKCLFKNQRKRLRTGISFWRKIPSKMLFKVSVSFSKRKFKCVIKVDPLESESLRDPFISSSGR